MTDAKILIVGAGKGSFEMRGLQLGAAMGARVVSQPTEADVRWADLVILVKRAGVRWASAVQRFQKPIVWDALDCWAQPGQNGMSEVNAKLWLQDQLRTIAPVIAIGATQAMADALGGRYLPHQSRIGLAPRPIRPAVRMVAYDGGAVFLGRWGQVLQASCARRGWSFVVNPHDIGDADLIVAFRDGVWDGWMCRQWKSGVKAVNAICAGRPFITQASAATAELQPLGAVVEDATQLEDAFDAWSTPEARARAYDAGCARVKDFTVEAIAARYLELLESQVMLCPR